jgi:capsular exopolysaccharide synthesis family protein
MQPEAPYIAESEVSLGEYWNVLVRRRGIILLLFLLIFSATAYFALSATALYTASATVKIEPSNPTVTGVGEFQSIESRGDYDYHQTQFALLRSRALAARVVDQLDLKNNKSFTDSRVVSPNPVDHIKSWMSRVLGYFSYYLAPLFRPERAQEVPAPIGPVLGSDKLPIELSVDRYLIDGYLGFVEVAPVRDTRLVRVNFTTPDPALSQALANAHVQTFVQMNFEGRFSLTEEARDYLDQKKTELREKLAKSEVALNNFRRQHGVVSVEKGENIVVDRLVDLNKQLTTARAQRIEAESLYRTIENRSYQDLAEIMKQGLVQQLKSNIATLEAEKARLGTVFKPDHPRIQELNKQIALAREAFEVEVASVIRGIKANYAAAFAKERGLQNEAENQQQDALKLKELGVDYTVLQEEVNANRSLYENVLKRLSETNVSNDLAVSNMQIIERAAKPSGPSGPNVPGFLTAGLISGLVFGVGAAFLLEFFDSMVHTPEDVWRAVGLSTLGVVPHLKFLKAKDGGDGQVGRIAAPANGSNGNGTRSLSKDLIITHNPLSVINESYRTIRTSLLLSQAEKPPQVILLTSPSPGEGKTVTSVNLAIALAHDGYSVLLIDGDMRKGTCHHRLGILNRSGLSNVLTSRVSPEEAIQQTPVRGLSFLSRGRVPPNTVELLGSSKMKSLTQELRRSFEFIVIDSPPVVGISDAAVLSVLSDGVLLVLNGERTSTTGAQKAVERLDMVRARLIGVVLNGVNLKDPNYSYFRGYEPYYTYGSSIEEGGVASTNGNGSLNGHSGYAKQNGHPAMFADDELEGRDPTDVKKNGTPHSESAGRGAEAEVAKLVRVSPNEATRESSSNRSTALDPLVPAAPSPSNGPSAHDSLQRVIEALTETMGPIGVTIVHEHIAALGESRYAFPKKRVGELLKSLEAAITEEELRTFTKHFRDSGRFDA